MADQKHIVFVMANNSSVPYFNWFARESVKHPGIKFSFVCLYPEEPEMLKEMREVGCDCYWVRFDARRRKSSMILSAAKLFFLFLRLRPDVVHTHLFDDSVPALFAARLAAIRMRVITKADTGFHYYYSPEWVRFDRFNNNNATHIVAISEECKEFVLEKENARPEKVTVIHHGVPEAEVTAQKDEFLLALRDRFELNNRFVIGTVARLIEWKGQRKILEVAKNVVQEHPQVKFLLVGQGQLQEELESTIKTEGLEDIVVLTGWIDREMVPSIYGVLDVYLHAARLEPFGFVIAEAMMNGCTVVSTPTGAARDGITNSENGFLVDYDDLDGLQKILGGIIQGDLSVDGDVVRESSRIYRFSEMWKNHITFYESELSS